MQRTIQRAILRNRNGGKTHHYRLSDGGRYDRAPRAFKAERQRQAERRIRWLFGRKRENKAVTMVPETKAAAE